MLYPALHPSVSRWSVRVKQAAGKLGATVCAESRSHRIHSDGANCRWEEQPWSEKHLYGSG